MNQKPPAPPRSGLVAGDADDDGAPRSLPLKGVLTEFAVAGGVADVTMVQVFWQENDRPLNCRYLFPLPADVAICHCDIELAQRRLVARVEELGRALALQREAWQAGHRTVLVEAERENLFTLSLGSVQPGDFVEVRLRYVQPLRRVGDAWSLEIPFHPGVRYFPGRPLLRSNRGPGVADDTDAVPDASRISPPTIPRDHPDAAFLEVQGRIDAAFADPGSVTSLSHAIVVTEEEGWARVGLRRHGELLDLNLVLRWQEPAPPQATARGWTCRRGADTYAWIELRAPSGSAPGPGPSQPPGTETSEGGAAKGRGQGRVRDLYLLVERSANVGETLYRKALEVLQILVAGLHDGERVMITLFNSAVRDFAEAPQTKREVLSDPEFGNLHQLGTRGGADLVGAVDHVLELRRRHSADRPSELVLITGESLNHHPGVAGRLKEARDLRVHQVGFDAILLEQYLRTGTRGAGDTFQAFHPRDERATLAAGLQSVLGPPVWRDFEEPGPDAATGPIPDLHPGQVHHVSLRFTGPAPPRVQLRARDAEGHAVVTDVPLEPAPHDAPYLLWTRNRIRRLLEDEATVPEAIARSKEAGLLCPRTAFVAWDETHQVPVADDHLFQPHLDRTLFGGTLTLREPGSPPLPREIVELARSDLAGVTLRARIADGFDRRERREALSAQFLALRRRAGAPGGAEAFARGLDWAAGAATDRESEDRFAELQACLAEFERLVEGLEGRTKHLRWQLETLESELRGAADRVREFVGRPATPETAVAVERRRARVRSAVRATVQCHREWFAHREKVRQWPASLPRPTTPVPGIQPTHDQLPT